MGFAAKLTGEHDNNPAWKSLSLVFVVNQPPETLEQGSLEHLKDNCFGVGSARAAGAAKRTILLDRSKSFNEFLGTEEYSGLGQLARIFSGYWARLILKSLYMYPPRNFLTAFVDVRIGSFVWRGRTPGGIVLASAGGKVLLKHSETQPGDHVDWDALSAGVLALSQAS